MFIKRHVLTILPFITTACVDLEESTETEDIALAMADEDSSLAELDASTESDSLLFDDRLLAIAQEVPQFVGFFVRHDERGSEQLFVRVTDDDPAVLERLETALEDWFPGLIPEVGYDVLVSEYGFAELKLTQQRLNKYLGTVPGLISTDVDEELGRVVLGIAEEDAFARVREAVVESEVDADMVELELRPRAELTASLTDAREPVINGLSIGHPGGGCTLGFTTFIQGVRGFVTASHCTKGWGSMQSTVINQPAPWYPGSRRVGVENKDPSFFPCTYKDKLSNTHKSATQCRYSDAAFIKLDDGVNISRRMAWAGSGSFTYTTTLPVVSRDEGLNGSYDAVVGRQVQHIGVGIDEDGREKGTISGMCVDILHENSGKVFLCNIEAATLNSAGGDSGGPVFVNRAVNGSPSNKLHLIGILWGKNGRISPFKNIRRELVVNDDPTKIKVCDSWPPPC